MEYELTDDEMVQAVYDQLDEFRQMRVYVGTEHQAIAKAQRKKLILDIERASREGEDDKAFMMVPMSYWEKLGLAHGIEPDEVE